MQPCGTFNEDYSHDMAIVRTNMQWGLLIGILVLIFTLPLFVNPHILGISNMIVIAIIGMHGLNILTGYTGLVSLGHAAAIGIGAYSCAILARFGLPLWVTMPCAGLITALLGLIFGIPSLRTKGIYLAIATVAMQMIFTWFIGYGEDLTGGFHGLSVPYAQIGGLVFDSPFKMYYMIMPIAVVITFFAKNMARTRIGRALIAIRDNDIAAEVMGVNLFRYKLLSFFICFFIAGIAGSLFAYNTGRVIVEQFSFIESIWYLGMLVIGGMGTTLGPILGVIAFRISGEIIMTMSSWLGSTFAGLEVNVVAGLTPLIFGLMIILFLIFEPRGLSHRWELFKSRYRIWPFSS